MLTTVCQQWQASPKLSTVFMSLNVRRDSQSIIERMIGSKICGMEVWRTFRQCEDHSYCVIIQPINSQLFCLSFFNDSVFFTMNSRIMHVFCSNEMLNEMRCIFYIMICSLLRDFILLISSDHDDVTTNKHHCSNSAVHNFTSLSSLGRSNTMLLDSSMKRRNSIVTMTQTNNQS